MKNVPFFCQISLLSFFHFLHPKQTVIIASLVLLWNKKFLCYSAMEVREPVFGIKEVLPSVS